MSLLDLYFLINECRNPYIKSVRCTRADAPPQNASRRMRTVGAPNATSILAPTAPRGKHFRPWRAIISPTAQGTRAARQENRAQPTQMLTGTALTPGSCTGERSDELALEVAGKHHNCVVTAQILGGAFLNIANTHSVSNLLGLLLGGARQVRDGGVGVASVLEPVVGVLIVSAPEGRGPARRGCRPS